MLTKEEVREFRKEDILDDYCSIPSYTESITIHQVVMKNKEGRTRLTKYYYATYEVKAYRNFINAWFHGGEVEYIKSQRLCQKYPVFDTGFMSYDAIPFKEKDINKLKAICSALWKRCVNETPNINEVTLAI